MKSQRYYLSKLGAYDNGLYDGPETATDESGGDGSEEEAGTGTPELLEDVTAENIGKKIDLAVPYFRSDQPSQMSLPMMFEHSTASLRAARGRPHRS